MEPSSTAPNVRVLKCQISGKEFHYKGVGRPPKYAPDVKRPRKQRAKKAA